MYNDDDDDGPLDTHLTPQLNQPPAPHHTQHTTHALNSHGPFERMVPPAWRSWPPHKQLQPPRSIIFFGWRHTYPIFKTGRIGKHRWSRIGDFLVMGTMQGHGQQQPHNLMQLTRSWKRSTPATGPRTKAILREPVPPVDFAGPGRVGTGKAGGTE